MYAKNIMGALVGLSLFGMLGTAAEAVTIDLALPTSLRMASARRFIRRTALISRFCQVLNGESQMSAEIPARPLLLVIVPL